MPTLVHWLTMAGATFAGGALTYLVGRLGSSAPSSKADWMAAGAGAVGCGLAALSHLYMTPPSSKRN